MITLTLEAILGILLVIVLMNFFKKHSTPAAPAQPDNTNLKPTDARTGDVISIVGAGDNLSDLDFTADRTAWVQAGSRNWREVSGMYHERRVSMRASSGEDDIEVAVHNDPRKLTLEDLGLSENDLAEMDERQNTADTFEFDGKVWGYRFSREAQIKRDDLPQPTGYYYWEFQEQGGKGALGVRKPEGEPFLVTLYSSVAPSDVTLFRGAKF